MVTRELLDIHSLFFFFFCIESQRPLDITELLAVGKLYLLTHRVTYSWLSKLNSVGLNSVVRTKLSHELVPACTINARGTGWGSDPPEK